VNGYESWRGKGGVPDHRNMTIFQLADKSTFSTSNTSRIAIWFLSIVHAGASSNEEDNESGGKVQKPDKDLYTASFTDLRLRCYMAVYSHHGGCARHRWADTQRGTATLTVNVPGPDLRLMLPDPEMGFMSQYYSHAF
jgi:hypothetical protein